MKKILTIISITILTIIPHSLNAEIKSEGLIESLQKEEIEVKCPDYKETEEQAIIYLFKQYGEEKSIDFLNYLNDICEEYGQFFKLKSYEVYTNEDNRILFSNVIDYLKSQTSTVPFMVIGDSYFITFNEKNQENVLKTFLRLYQMEDKPDKVEEVLVQYYRNDALMVGIFFGISFGLIAILIIARITNKNRDKN